MIDYGRYSVLGVRIAAVDYELVVNMVIRAAKARCSFAVSALAVHGVMTGVFDREHQYRLNTLELVVPDGQPVRWALRLLHGVSLPDRVYGPTLMLRVCEVAEREKLSIFLYGSRPEVLSRLRSSLQRRFPGLVIAGMQPSRFRRISESEQRDDAEKILDSGASIIFVGLGCPRQEVWVYEMRSMLPLPMLAVGAAFDFHAGVLPQAPHFLQEVGLEWAFRLTQEPNRLWRRYVLLNPLYLALLMAQKTGLVRFEDKGRLPQPLRYG